MADEEPDKPLKIEPYPAQFPNGYSIPEDLLAQWVALPEDEPLVLGPLTRANIDQLLFSSGEIARSVAALRAALILFSQGDIKNADICLQNCNNHIVDGDSRNRMLFKAIIESILKVRNAAK